MSFPGPDCLGRGLVLPPSMPVPACFADCPEVVVDDAVLRAPAKVVEALHRAWGERRRVIVRLGVSAEALREPQATAVEPYRLGARFEFERERLCFLVWANCYDATGGEPIWRLAAHAVARLGARPSRDADVTLPDGTHAWCDGGPRGGVPVVVVHGESIAAGVLEATAPADTSAPARDLADDQRRAVLHPSGAARVIAPAGSGKTRVLAARLHHLLGDRRYEPSSVTAVAYNKRAAVELERRVRVPGARVRTLHALGYDVLRRRGEVRVLQEREVRNLIAKMASVEPQKGKDPLAAWIEALAEVRLALRAPEEVERTRAEAVKGFTAFFPRYREALRRMQACDHDEQIYGAIEHLLAHPEDRRRYQRQCRHLLVDEFQDLTPAYMLLVRLLAAPAYQVFGVGDDDQVIYGYLGATPDYLIRYSRYFPGAREYALEANYRCHPQVVEAARRVLAHNRQRVAKQIVAAARPEGAGLQLREESGADMASRVVETVTDAVTRGHKPHNIAILSRVNDSLLPVQLALRHAGIACSLAVDGGMMERSGVRAAMAWLALATTDGPMPGDMLGEAMTRPSRKIYRATIERVARQNAWSDRDLHAMARGLKAWEADEVQQFVVDLQRLRGMAKRGTSTADLLRVLRAQIGLGSDMNALDESRSDASGSNHFDQLLALEQVAALHPTPATFEDWLREELRGGGGDADGVTLSTVHRVKGMEWDIVIVYHATEGLMPHRLSGDVEEERRVFHVAITRGRRLVFVFAESGKASRFVKEASAPTQPSVKKHKKQPHGR